VHPRYVVLTIPEDRPRDMGTPAARSSSIAAATSSVKNSTTGRVVKCVFSEGPNTSALLRPAAGRTRTSSPLWLKRRLKTLRKKSAIASGFSVRVPTYQIFDNLTDERLLRLPDPPSEPVA
jgi:hypothetical protein